MNCHCGNHKKKSRKRRTSKKRIMTIAAGRPYVFPLSGGKYRKKKSLRKKSYRKK